MWAKIISTVFVRGYAAVANLVLVILSAKLLGAYARGEIALVVLGVSIIGMFQALVGGPSLTYFAAKRNIRSLILSSTWWSLLSAISLGLLLGFTGLSPKQYTTELVLISAFQGILISQQSYLVGREKVYQYGLLEALRTTVLWSYVTVRFFIFNSRSVEEVLFAYLVANALSVLFGFLLFYRPKEKDSLPAANLNELFKYGGEIQLNNLSQLFNYRFVFYLVEKVKGTEALGVFSVAIAVAESLWIICKSIATIQLSRLLNLSDLFQQRKLSLNLAGKSVFLTLIATGLVLLIPERVYVLLFGKAFGSIPVLLIYFSPAIILLSYYTILNHFFIARNQNWVNIRAGIVGNALLLVLSKIFIIQYSLAGAAFVYVIAYLGISLYLTFAFIHKSKI